MAAVFTGNGLGLFNTSLTQLGNALGGSAGLGQGLDRQFVNIATGNLLLQGQDEFITVHGFGLSFNRTYNSSGTLIDVGADGWLTGFERRVTLQSGTLNAAGSVMRRYTGDGAYQDFTYVSANNYRSTGGDGAHDTLVYDSTWLYTEGSTQRKETYASHTTYAGRLLLIQDAPSNDNEIVGSWSVIYGAGNRITEIRDSVGGTSTDALLFGYDASGRLNAVATRENGQVKSQVWYEYDASGRLTAVITDLSPDVVGTVGATRTGDNLWNATAANNDGKLFRTSYAYEDTSLRVSTVTQSDGTLVFYTYHPDGKVKTVTRGDNNINDADGLGETITYAYNANSTTVTDSLGRVWTYAYDTNKQLTSVTSPAVNGQSDVTSYVYDASGNVTQVKTERGAATLSLLDYQYDANGNVTWEWDAQGNAINRTFSASNQLLTETRYTGVDADRTGAGLPTGGMTTNYIYDSQNRVRFVVNSLGEVTESAYATTTNGLGQQSAVRQYLGDSYTGAMTLAALTSWGTAARKGQGTLSEFTYDAWGRLSQRTDYASVNTSGVGVLDATTSIIRYTYDAQGLLRQQIALHGTTRTLTGTAPIESEVTDYTYDGIGRLLGVLTHGYGVTAPAPDASPELFASYDRATLQTTYAYIDSAYQIMVTTDAGAVTTQIRNAAGRVLSVSQAGTVAGATVTRTTQNWYDSAGQLRISQDASGGRSYFFYDTKGRLEATVDATGAGVRNSYDGVDRVVGTRAYAGRVTTTGWTSLALMPADFAATGLTDNNALDRITLTTYDSAGRIATVADGVSGNPFAITTYTYDAAGRLVNTRQADEFDNTVTAHSVRFFYDNAGRQVGVLDVEGYLIEFAYDRAGRLVSQVRYATVSPSAQWAAGTLTQLRPTADAANDQTTRNYYNGRSQLVGTLDAQGYLTEYVIDEAGNTRAERRFSTQLSWVSNDTLTNLRTRAGATNYREGRMAYNTLGQLVTQTNPESTVTRYTYDEAGHLVKTEMAVNTSEVRENNRRYNVFGELIGELGGEGSVQLLAGMSEAQLDAVYAQYGVRHGYDSLGRRIESIDALGNKTWYFYDSASRVTFTVKGVTSGGIANALGEVTENRYTAFGEVSDSLIYTGRITIPTPGDRNSVSGAISTLAYAAVTDTRRQFAYTTRGQLASVTDGENTLTEYTYDPFGQLSSRVAASGTAAASTQHYSYDRRGLLVDTTDDLAGPNRRLTTSTYDAFGRVVGQHSANGSVTSFTYDRLGRQITRAGYGLSGQEEVWTTAYDAFSRITSVTDAMGHASTYFHDDTARSLTITSSEGVAVTTVHNRHGQTLTVTDDAGRIVATNSYNRDGQLTSATDALGHAASNEYDARGLLVATVDASGRRVELRYDAVGRVLQRIEDPGTGKLNFTTAYAYDGQGRQLTVTDASGRVTGYSYDREGRLTQVALDPAGLNYRTAYAYDAAGRQVRVTEGAGTASARVAEYNYDSLNRRISEVVDPGTGKLNLTTQYAYDNNDNLIRRTDANGAVTRYYYDESNRLVATVDPLGGATRQWYDLNGRLVASRSFAQAVDPAVLNDAADFYQVDAAMVWNANDLGQFQVYDEDGHLRFQFDVSGSVREVLYDAAERVVGTRTYATNFASALLDLAGPLHAGLVTVDDVVGRISGNGMDQLSWQVLDNAGRARYTIDALGNVQEMYYDAANRLVGTRAYATPIALNAGLRSGLSDGTTSLASVAVLISADDAKDQRNYKVFDTAGRLRYSVDAFGAVQEYLQDAAGRIVGSRRYAEILTIDSSLLVTLKAGLATIEDIAGVLVPDEDADQQEYYVYDASGRARFTVKVSGSDLDGLRAFVEETRYDAAGLVTQTVAYGFSMGGMAMAATIAAMKNGSLSISSVIAWVNTNVANTEYPDDFIRSTVYVLDASGRTRYVLTKDTWLGTYAVQEFRYDAVGNRTSDVRYGVSIPSATSADVSSVALAINTAGGDSASNQRQTRFVFDDKGRQRFSIDDLGGVTEWRYDSLGQMVESRQYGQFVSATIAATEELLAAAVSGFTGADVRSTLHAYDNAGRNVSVTDAAGFTEAYAYDAVGNRTSTTNKLGNVWTYEYDAAGRLVRENSPAVSVNVFDEEGIPTGWYRSISTVLSYDAMGNVISRTEDATGTQPRTTHYEYDNRGNQIRTIFPDAGRVDAATGVIVATGIQTTIQVTYNALGQAVVQKDVRGNYSYKAYDLRGNIAFEVDAKGYFTQRSYNSFGQEVFLKRFDEPVAIGHIAGWAPGDELTADAMTNLATARAGHMTEVGGRVLWTVYDVRGNKIQVNMSNVNYVLPDGEISNFTSTGTYFAYNSYGDLVTESVSVGYSQSSNFLTVKNTYQYDELGRVIRVIDFNGYYSDTRYNANGEIVETVETGGTHGSAGNATIGYDRVVRYGYDALGRKISETMLRYYQDGGGATQFRDVTTIIGYDAEGHAVSTVVDGVTTETIYDTLGRVTGVKEDEREVVRADSESLLLGGADLNSPSLYERVSPYSSMTYDAFGNVVGFFRSGRGLLEGQYKPGPSENDMLIITRYDWQGRAVWERDALGSVTTRVYDEADHVLQTRSRLDGNDGAWAAVVSTATYDELGQQITSEVSRERYQDSTLLDVVGDSSSQVRYNGFGEIIAKDSRLDSDLATSSFAAQFVYDQVGRLIRSNADGGIWRDYGYDLTGNRVRESHEVRIVGPYNTYFGNAITLSVVDLSGRVLQQTLPAYSDDLGALPVISQVYDRWGNVIEVTDARGGKTSYEYNQSNQVTLEKRPEVRVVNAAGQEALARPEIRSFYDARGQLIATQDANGKIRRSEYDATGRLTASYDAYDNVTLQAYDALGRQRLTQDPLGYVNFRDFDNAGRITAQGDYLVDNTGTARIRHVREQYALNQNGDRLSVTNEMNQTARYDYDSRGLVIRSRTAEGVVMAYEYDSQGNKIRETNALSDPSLAGIVPPPINMPLQVPNGNFESGSPGLSAPGWDLVPSTGATLEVVSGSHDGSNAVRLTGTGEGQDGSAFIDTAVAVTPGQSVTASVRARISSGTFGTSYSLVFIWYDANGVEISRSGQTKQELGNVGDEWRVNTYSASAPTGAASMKVGVYLNASDSSTASIIWVDDFTWNLTTPIPSDGRTQVSDREEESVYLNEQTWDYDYFGRVIDHNDLGGADYDYVYDEVTGQLWDQNVGEVSGGNTPPSEVPGAPVLGGASGGDRQYSYYANGQIKEIRELFGESENWTRYTYDAAGNRTSEETSTHDANGEVLHMQVSTTYDAHNRIARVVQDDLGTGRRILDVRYSYDAAGNRRHVEAGTSYNPSGDQPVNAGFEDGDTGWSLGAGWSITQDSAYTGGWGARYDGSGPHSISNDARTPVQVGQTVSASVMVQQGASSAGDASARILIVWYDANGVPLPGGEGRTWVGGNLVNSGSNGEWKKSQVSTRVPAGAAFMGVEVSANKSSSHPLFIDDVQWSYQSDGSDGELTINQSYWFAYDDENRVTVVNGQLVNGQIVIADDDKSYELGYDNAGHATARTFIDNGAVKHEVTQYDPRGQRASTFEVAGIDNVLQDSYLYDEAGRQLEHREYFEPGTLRNGVDIGGWLKHAEVTTYDDDGRVLSTTVKGRALDWVATGGQPGPQSNNLSSLVDLATVDYATAGYDEAGRLNGYSYHYIRHEEGSGASSEDPANYTHTYTYTYEGHESYLEQQVSGVSSNGTFKPSNSHSTYDAWGRRIAILEQTPHTDVDDRVRYFSYDAEGNILRRREGTVDNGAFTQDDAAVLQTQLYAYVSGQHIGSGKYNGELDVIGRLAAYDSSETGSSKITVQSGDTLRGIAQRVYGNSNLWYVIAQANAIQDDSELAAGATLTIPEVKVTANDANTFKPFDPSEAVGNTSPSLPYIQPPPDTGCNALAMILIVVVVIVVTVFTAGAAAAAIAPGVTAAGGATATAAVGGAVLTGTAVTATGAALGAGASIAAGAIAGAAGALAGQALGSVLGVSSFSWRNVAAGAVTGGLTAGFAQWAQGITAFTRGAEVVNGAQQLNTLGRVAQGVASYGGSVVANAAVGNKTHFSWNAVAASAVGAAISAQVGGRVPTLQGGTAGVGLVNDFTGYFVNGGVNASANRLFGLGKQDWGDIAADAFGNALANAAVRGIQTWQANRTGIGPVEREQISMEPMPLEVDDIAYDIRQPSLAFDLDSAISTPAAIHAPARLVSTPTRTKPDFSDVVVNVSSTEMSNVTTLETVTVVGTRPRDLTMDDFAEVWRQIASGPRQDIAKGIRLFDRDALDYAEGSFGGRVRSGAEFDAREAFRAQLQQADANSKGNAQLVMLAPDGMSSRDKMVNAIRVGGGYISEEVGQNLLDQINSGADAIDLTYARAQSEGVLNALQKGPDFLSLSDALSYNSSDSAALGVEIHNARKLAEYRASDSLLPVSLAISELGVEREVGRAFALASTLAGIPDLVMLPLALSRGTVINRAPALGVLNDAAFAQVPAKSTKAFSERGQEIYTLAAGQPIRTVGDLTDALTLGGVKPSQVPLDYVVINGQKVISNTRSSTALINAGIPKSQWYGANKTGIAAYGDVTFDDLVRNQLIKNYGGSVQKARR